TVTHDPTRTDDVIDDARWEPSGPNTDEPPWATGETDSDQTAPADEAGDDADTDGEAADQEPAEGAEGAEGAAPEGRAGHAAGGPGAELQARGGIPHPPPPPRRTGVFLDPEDLREHVGGLLRVMLGGYQVDAWGNYTFVHE